MARKEKRYDVIIVGSGPAGLGAAFHLCEKSDGRSILLIDKAKVSSGGLRNDCKQNYTYPVGFPRDLWSREEATVYLERVATHLNPVYQTPGNIQPYVKRAEKLGVTLLSILQAHVGTDRALPLIKGLLKHIEDRGVEVSLGREMLSLDYPRRRISVSGEEAALEFTDLILAPGRAAYGWIQQIMRSLEVPFSDNIVDVGIRLEARAGNYPIVKDYYDPKFIFPDGVRTFCTNSGSAHVVKEKYEHYYSVNGHSFSTGRTPNGLVNFAMLKTISLTDPVVSGHEFAVILGQMAMQLSGGKPMMQRVGDFRMGNRSKASTFNDDLYDFKPTLKGATPGDITLAMPARILRDIWKSLKMLDTIVPGILHPSTILYYPEIKTYANRPRFSDRHFQIREGVYIIGDGAGTSRGITAAWASGIRAAEGILGAN